MTKINFQDTFELTGDVTIEGPDSDSMRIWLSTALGTISDGIYKDTSVVGVGSGIGIYVRREGKAVGTMLIDLGPLVSQALTVFEAQEARAQALTR